MTDLQPSQPDEPLFSAEPEPSQPEIPADSGSTPPISEAEPIPPASPPVSPEPQPVAAAPTLPPAPQSTTPQPAPPPVRRKRRGSLFFPLLLIALGAVLLLNNLGYITGSVWDTLISLWPVLFIAWGLDSIWRGDGVTGAVFLLGLGIVFLLGNFGYLRLNPWQVFLTIWPVLLVAVGIDILLSRRRRWWTTLLGFILVAAVMVGALWLAGVSLPGGQVVAGEKIEFGLQGATRAEVQLSPAAGSLDLDRLVNSTALLAGTIPESTATQQITQQFTKTGDTAFLKLQSTGSQVVYETTSAKQFLWDLGLTPNVPVDLKVNLGAGDANLDLTGLQISNLNYDMGVGALTITLPADGNFTATVDGAVGSITIVVPAGTAVQVNMDTALTARSLPAGFVKTGDHIFASPEYSTAQNRVVLDLNLAIGQVSIKAK